jgi:hypothetical protein
MAGHLGVSDEKLLTGRSEVGFQPQGRVKPRVSAAYDDNSLHFRLIMVGCQGTRQWGELEAGTGRHYSARAGSTRRRRLVTSNCLGQASRRTGSFRASRRLREQVFAPPPGCRSSEPSGRQQLRAGLCVRPDPAE